MADPLMTAAQVQPQSVPALERPQRQPQSIEEQIVARRMNKEWPIAIAKDLGMTRHDVVLIVQKAQRAGVQFPVIRQPKPGRNFGRKKAPPEAPKPETFVGKRVFQSMEELNAGAKGQMTRAATKRGLDLKTYMDLRERIVQLRLQGENAENIMRFTGQPYNTVKDILQIAVQRGVVLPYLPRERRA